MTEYELSGLQEAAETLEGLVERVRALWLLGDSPSPDELRDWWVKLESTHECVEGILFDEVAEDE
jgi:hypothetical protein